MKSAKEFAAWLMERFEAHSDVWLTRGDITQLTSRQSLRSEFIHDVHCELMNFGRGLIADIKNDRYYMVSLSDTYWKDVGDIYAARTSPHIEPFPAESNVRKVQSLHK